MNSEKITIKNRKDQKVVVLLEKNENQNGLAFVMHGLSGFKEQPHIERFAKSFRDKGFTVVRFDTTNTFGESEGKYEEATITSYFEDLEDVINWASSQDWYEEPFWLVGHSLGGISVILYAQKYPEKVKALAPISTVVSGQLSLDAPSNVGNDWESSGWKVEKSDAIPGLIKKTPWSHMEDRLKYDVLPQASVLTMPILLIVGSLDDSTPLEHQQLLFDAIPGNKKELHVIEGSGHTFRDKKHLDEVERIISNWILKYK